MRLVYTICVSNKHMENVQRNQVLEHSEVLLCMLKVEECNEPSCEALIFPYGVVLFNIFSTICI